MKTDLENAREVLTAYDGLVDSLRAELAARGAPDPADDDYRCVNGHDYCNQMYPGPNCPYCERVVAPDPVEAMRAENERLLAIIASSDDLSEAYDGLSRTMAEFDKAKAEIVALNATLEFVHEETKRLREIIAGLRGLSPALKGDGEGKS
jgi:hypothetical protein